MTLTEIIAAVQSNHARPDRETITRTAITLASQEAIKIYDWEQLQQSVDTDIVADTSYITLPAEFKKLKEARVINGINSYDLKVKNRELVLRDYPNVDSDISGYPRFCYVESSQLYILPKTSIDSTIRVTYHANPSFATDDDELSPTLHGWDAFLIDYATARVFLSLQMFKEGNAWMSMAFQELATAYAFDQRNAADDRIKEDVQVIPREALNPEDPFNGQNGGTYGT